MNQQEAEAIQFKLKRVFNTMEFGMLLRHSLGGQGIVNFVDKKVKAKRLEEIPQWDSEDRCAQEEVIAMGICHLFAHDPALLPLFESILDATQTDFEPIFYYDNEIQLNDLLGSITRKYIEEVSRANSAAIKEVSAMPLHYLDAHVMEVLRSGDKEQRWKTAWALAVDPKLTRISALTKLCYQTVDEILGDYQFLFKPQSEGGIGLPAPVRRELGFDVDRIKFLLWNFREYQRKGQLVMTNHPEMVIAHEEKKDLEEELKIYRAHCKLLERNVESEQARVHVSEQNREELKKNYQRQIETLERRLREQPAPAVIKSANPSRQERIAAYQAERPQEKLKELTDKLGAAEQKAKNAENQLRENELKMRDMKTLLELVRLRDEMSRFYTGKRVAVVIGESHKDQYSAQIAQFGADVVVLPAVGKVRRVQSLLDAEFDFYFIPPAGSSAVVKDRLEGAPVIFYHPKAGSVEQVLFNTMASSSAKAQK